MTGTFDVENMKPEERKTSDLVPKGSYATKCSPTCLTQEADKDLIKV